MSKVWDKPITADTDWGGDASTDNLPVSGRQVQAWIKGNIKNDDAISLLIAKWLNEHTTNSITFWKGLPIDSGTLKWVDKHLTVIGGTGGSETPQDLPFIYDPVKKAWEFKGDFVVTGAITMFGSLSGFQPSTVTEAVEVDGETIVKTKNSQGQWQLTAIGRGGGTGGGISAAEVNILISNALEPYALSTSIPTDNKQLLNGAGYATVGDLDTRINNLINGAPAAYDTLKEIADVLAGNVNSIGDILTALDTKATKTYVDAELEKYVKLATAQSIEAQHNFVNGLQIGSLPITKSASANNTIYLDANLVVSGAITMFGKGSTTFPTIWANIPFNLEHMSWDGSQWNIKGGGGTGSVDDATVRGIVSEVLGEKGYATEKWVTDKDYASVSVVSSAISSALVGYATQSWVLDNYLSKSGGTVNGSITANSFIGNLTGNADSATLLGNRAVSAQDFDALNFANNGLYCFDGDYINGVGLPPYYSRNYSVLNMGLASGRRQQIAIPYDTVKMFVRTNVDDTWKTWREVAFVDSTVEAANRLAAPRTIWGRSFDGTEDVYGTLYGVNFIRNINANIIICEDTTDGDVYVGSSSFAKARVLINANGQLALTASGNVAIGRTSASVKLHVGGDIIADGAITMFSQLSMKNVIDYDGLSLAQLAQIQPARFTWKDGRDSLVHAGGIADEVMRVLPEVVYKTSDAKLTMDYGSAGFFVAASLIKPVIDHEKRIEELEREVEYLRNENKQLRVS